MVWKVPIDPPGPNFTRVIRITNVRSNASQLGVPRGFYPLFLTANVAIKGSNPPQFGPPQAVLAMSEEGLLASTVSSASIPQCQPHNAALLGGAGTPAFDFNVQAEEGFSYSFRYRNYGTFLSGPEFPPVLDEQNVLGYNYATETGFYSPSLLTPAPTIGLADFGTRILVSLGSVSAGTKLFVPTTITLTGSYGIGAMSGTLQLVQAGASGNSAPGYQPVASTAMIGTTPVAEANSSGSTAYAVYEVIYSDPSVQETATIPVAVAFTNRPAIGSVNANTSLAPLSMVGTASQAAPIPRFTNFSSAQPAYSIAARPPVRQ
jgi:hypothetical protein